MQGLIHLYCGDGKGKTTAAVGLSVRAAGAGKRVLFAQFFIFMIPLLFLMGVTLPQYCCAWIYNWIFRRIDGEIDAKGRKVAQS